MRKRPGIILILILIAGLILGSLFSSFYDETNEGRSSLVPQSAKIHMLGANCMHDCVLDNSSSHHQLISSLIRRGIRAGAFIFGAMLPADLAGSLIPDMQPWCMCFFMLALLGISIRSNSHIRFLHRKDGGK